VVDVLHANQTGHKSSLGKLALALPARLHLIEFKLHKHYTILSMSSTAADMQDAQVTCSHSGLSMMCDSSPT
jgi:hypothetical protein